MSPQPDKTQLAMTEEAREKADEIVAAAGFKDRQDAYRLAVAIALAERLDPAPADVTRGNYAADAGVDPDGALRAATRELRDDHEGRPAALIERLAEAGIDRLHAEVHAGRSLRETLERYRAEPSGG